MSFRASFSATSLFTAIAVRLCPTRSCRSRAKRSRSSVTASRAWASRPCSASRTSSHSHSWNRFDQGSRMHSSALNSRVAGSGGAFSATIGVTRVVATQMTAAVRLLTPSTAREAQAAPSVTHERYSECGPVSSASVTAPAAATVLVAKRPASTERTARRYRTVKTVSPAAWAVTRRTDTPLVITAWIAATAGPTQASTTPAASIQ